jgi:hypothetical protein
MADEPLRTLRFLLARLERISVDSVTAHRASGVRGAMLKELERLEKTGAGSGERVKCLIEWGYALLEQAAEEKIR